MADRIEPLDLGPVRTALAEARPQLPSMPGEFWEEVELLLFAWHRGQRWRMVDVARTSVTRYARLLASFYTVKQSGI